MVQGPHGTLLSSRRGRGTAAAGGGGHAAGAASAAAGAVSPSAWQGEVSPNHLAKQYTIQLEENIISHLPLQVNSFPPAPQP
jgi:hypothetical protein